MKKLYIAPEMEMVTFTLKDVILNSPTEGDIPIVPGSSLPDDSELQELPELPDDL